ncbi:MAG: hypothetical protein AAFX50_15875, partial [Acidobacteriota bacterium]
RSRGEVALTLEDRVITGRRTQGSTLNRLGGTVDHDGGQLTDGLDVAGPLGRLKDTLSFRFDGGRVRVAPRDGFRRGTLRLTDGCLRGQQDERLGSASIDVRFMGGSDGPPAAMVVAATLCALKVVYSLEDTD